jgi:hypothetical protein
MAKAPRWLPIAAGIVVLLAFTALGVAIVGSSWMREHVAVSDGSSAEAAAAAFDEARARFAGQAPLLELDSRGTPRYVGDPAARARGGAVESVHVLAWFPKRHRLAHADLPFWLLRLKSGPIRLGAYVRGLGEHRVDLSPADIERFGPGLLLDADTRDGQHVLLWAQ